MINLVAELTGIVDVFNLEGIPYALIGGLAYSLYIEIRATEDIDFLIRADDWPRVIEAMKPLGFLAVADPVDAGTVRYRRLTKLESGAFLAADFLLSDCVYDAGIEFAQSFSLKGRTIKVAPPDVIIALKKGRMSDKDKPDIAGLEKLINGEGK